MKARWCIVALMVLAGCNRVEETENAIHVADKETSQKVEKDLPKKAEKDVAQKIDLTNGKAVQKVTRQIKEEIVKGPVPPPPGFAEKKAKPVSEKRFHIVDERPPETEDMYRTKYGKAPPRGVLFVRPENRLYSYCEGCRLFWHRRAEAWIPGDPED
jgi:hypothetical protein